EDLMTPRIQGSTATRTTEGNGTFPPPRRFVSPTAQSCSPFPSLSRRASVFRIFLSAVSTVSLAPSRDDLGTFFLPRTYPKSRIDFLPESRRIKRFLSSR